MPTHTYTHTYTHNELGLGVDRNRYTCNRLSQRVKARVGSILHGNTKVEKEVQGGLGWGRVTAVREIPERNVPDIAL